MMIAGTGGDSGKTLVTLGLISAWCYKGTPVIPFKKGPDFIDSAWLSLASGKAARNLDTWMMGEENVVRSFIRHSRSDSINLIEANRGLHDGENAAGTHSSAELSKLLKCPVILVLNAIKVTRTLAAIASGIKNFDTAVPFKGVILNQMRTTRQQKVIVHAMEDAGIEVFGIIPRVKKDPLPGRHLGLVTPDEHKFVKQSLRIVKELIADNVDLERLKALSESCVPIRISQDLDSCSDAVPIPDKWSPLNVGYFKGPAFTFYYPENLEALDQDRVNLIPIDPLNFRELPKLDALYIGGGFPETHADLLSNNNEFKESLRIAAEKGLPIFAECGGLIYLSRYLNWQGKNYPMAGVFQNDVTMSQKPRGHGYGQVIVDTENPFFKIGSQIKGHEFHYSQVSDIEESETIFSVKRGQGFGNNRDGLIYKNVVGSYLHIHAKGNEDWASGIINSALRFKLEENLKNNN